MSTSGTNNALKRKNDELEQTSDDQTSKRVALDSEQVELNDLQQEQNQTAPHVNQVVSDITDIETVLKFIEKASLLAKEAAAANAKQQQLQELQIENGLTDKPETQAYDTSNHQPHPSKPTSNHRERDNDPTYVQIRMYCPVKEASTIVGKKGDTINHIRDKANVRINVSDNLKDIPERIVTVRGPSEDVAKAFGLITRTILDEPEDEPASTFSKQYTLKILVPHAMVGYIIGKGGAKFREIEENSAAKLKAAEQPLPYSTDRVLAIAGVADAIHIAIYYISQTMLEHKDALKKNKIIFYNPANYHYNNVNIKMMNIGPVSQPGNQIHNHNPMGDYSHMNPMHHQPMRDHGPHAMHYNQPKQPYNFQQMFQPAVHPQQHYGAPPALHQPQMPINIPPQTPYTDEHGNNIVGDVITHSPVPIQGQSPDKFNQDIFVANSNIGSVIGKGGNNIKNIRENSGCTYVRIEADKGQSIMLGGGKGLTNIRKLTLTGNLQALQSAIHLINQRINIDKERNAGG
jgi:heterogeneous nuclear rnp K-like protein 2